MLSGDVYFYAYFSGALESLRSYYQPDFFYYMAHPFTSLLGFRAYDKPLGSMLASEMTGVDVVTGPNPQLPVLLDFFFQSNWALKFVLAVFLGYVPFFLRVQASKVRKGASRYVSLAVIALSVFLPTSAFADFSYTLGKGIGMVIGVVFLATYVAWVRFLFVVEDGAGAIQSQEALDDASK